MLDKLAQIETRYEELSNELSSPELLSNLPRMPKPPSNIAALVRLSTSIVRTVATKNSQARVNSPRTPKMQTCELAQIEIESLKQLEQTK